MTRADLIRRLVLLAGAGQAPAFAVARARAAVELARALDPVPSSFDIADLLLSLHPMAQLQNDDDAVKITISLIEAARTVDQPRPARPVPGRPRLAVEDTHLDEARPHRIPRLAMASSMMLVPPASRPRKQLDDSPLPVHRATCPGSGAPLLAADQVNPPRRVP